MFNTYVVPERLVPERLVPDSKYIFSPRQTFLVSGTSPIEAFLVSGTSPIEAFLVIWD